MNFRWISFNRASQRASSKTHTPIHVKVPKGTMGTQKRESTKHTLRNKHTHTNKPNDLNLLKLVTSRSSSDFLNFTAATAYPIAGVEFRTFGSLAKPDSCVGQEICTSTMTPINIYSNYVINAITIALAWYREGGPQEQSLKYAIPK